MLLDLEAFWHLAMLLRRLLADLHVLELRLHKVMVVAVLVLELFVVVCSRRGMRPPGGSLSPRAAMSRACFGAGPSCAG